MKTLTRLAGLLMALAALTAGTAAAASKLNVVATTEDLAALAREIGGDRINVDSIAKGYQDPHFVEPKPSFVLKLQKADLLVVVGLQLEIGWLPPLITQSRNSKIQQDAAGYLDASAFSHILEIPAGQVTPVRLGQGVRLGWTSWMSPNWSNIDETIRKDAHFHVVSRLTPRRQAA